MNDTFNLRRFAQLAYKHYWENKIKYLICILLAIVAIIMISPLKLISSEVLTTSAKLTSPFVREFETIEFLIVPMLCAVIASISTSVEKQRIEITNLLLPASNFERFLFIVLNSTVVALFISFVVYYGTSLFLESHIYIGDQNNIATLPILHLGESIDLSNYQRLDVISVEQFFNLGLLTENTHSFEINILGYSTLLMIISIAIWSNISFRRGLWGWLIHFAIIYILSWVFSMINMALISIENSVVKDFSHTVVIGDVLKLYFMPLLFVIAYLYSSYMKFKRL